MGDDAAGGCVFGVFLILGLLFLPYALLWCLSTIMPNSGAQPGMFTTQWFAALITLLLFKTSFTSKN